MVLRQAAQENVRLKAERDNLAQRRQQASGDANTQEAKEETPERKLGIAKMNFVRNWGAALKLFAEKNDGQLPLNLGAAAPYLQAAYATYPQEADKMHAAAAQYGIQDDQFEMVWQGSVKDLKSPQGIIVVREKQPFLFENGRWARTYLFADGHSEVHASTDGDFTAWEKERLPAPSQP